MTSALGNNELIPILEACLFCLPIFSETLKSILANLEEFIMKYLHSFELSEAYICCFCIFQTALP